MGYSGESRLIFSMMRWRSASLVALTNFSRSFLIFCRRSWRFRSKNRSRFGFAMA